MQCSFCQKETTNPKFCNRSCSVAYHNSVTPKRKKQVCTCVKCGKETTERRKRCIECWIPLIEELTTIGQLKSKMTTYAWHAKIRGHGRRSYASAKLPKICLCCSYSKHVEVCHRTPISSFRDEDTIATINNLSNLIALCPNCHWEFDNGLLKL